MRIFRNEKIIVLRKKKIKAVSALMLTAIITLLFLNYSVRAYVPYIKMKCEAGANNLLNEIINNAVQSELEGLSYDSFAKVTYDEKGSVKSVLCDTVKISLVKHRISEKILKGIKKNNSFYIRVPLVYISSNPLISDFGPRVSVKVSPSGVLNVDFNDSFVSVGINQTKHEINIVIKAGCYTYLAGINGKTNLTTTVPAVHTIIVGDVPETYTNVESEDGSVKDDVLNLQ